MITQQDITIAMLNNAVAQGKTKEDVLLEYISEHEGLSTDDGERYYYNENDILDKKVYRYDKDGNKIEADEKANNRIPHNYHKLLVDQKTQYLFGKPPTITGSDDSPDDFIQKADNLIDDPMDLLDELGTKTANKGRHFLHPFINPDGEFDLVTFDYSNTIPIYDTSYNKNIIAFIRYYSITYNGKEETRVEYWDDEATTYYITQGGNLVLDPTVENNPEPHHYKGNEGVGWGKVPLIEFTNNNKKVSDLQFYKALIDSYDKAFSKLFDNVDDVQEVILAVSGAGQMPAEEIRANFNFHKIIKTDSGGNVTSVEINIPVEARRELMDRLEKNIFLFGQGINFMKENLGNSPSGVALRFLYGALDQKASKMENKFKKGFRELFWFITEYINLDENKSYDYRDLDVQFNKSIITNDAELAEIASKSQGIISDETILEKHPWTESAKEEKERISNQTSPY